MGDVKMQGRKGGRARTLRVDEEENGGCVFACVCPFSSRVGR